MADQEEKKPEKRSRPGLVIRGPVNRGDGWKVYDGDKQVGATHLTKRAAMNAAYDLKYPGVRAKKAKAHKAAREVARKALAVAKTEQQITAAHKLARKAGLHVA